MTFTNKAKDARPLHKGEGFTAYLIHPSDPKLVVKQTDDQHGEWVRLP